MGRRLPVVIVMLLFAGIATGLSLRPWKDDSPAKAAASAPTSLLAQPPYMGVSCPVGNDIRCDRVKIAIWTSQPARHVTAAIGALEFDTIGSLAFGDQPLGTYWQAVLEPAGLFDGPLSLPGRYVQDGRWLGQGAPRVPVRIEIDTGEEATAVQVVEVTLSPGYG